MPKVTVAPERSGTLPETVDNTLFSIEDGELSFSTEVGDATINLDKSHSPIIISPGKTVRYSNPSKTKYMTFVYMSI